RVPDVVLHTPCVLKAHVQDAEQVVVLVLDGALWHRQPPRVVGVQRFARNAARYAWRLGRRPAEPDAPGAVRGQRGGAPPRPGRGGRRWRGRRPPGPQRARQPPDRGEPVASGGEVVAQAWPRRRLRRAGELVPVRPQPFAQDRLDQPDLPRPKPLPPGADPVGADLSVSALVPGLVFRHGDVGELLRLGHRRVVLLAEELAQGPQLRLGIGDQLLVPHLVVGLGAQFARRPPPVVDGPRPRGDRLVDAAAVPWHLLQGRDAVAAVADDVHDLRVRKKP